MDPDAYERFIFGMTTGYSDSFARRYLNDFILPNEQREREGYIPWDGQTGSYEPRPGYIDAGLVMTKGITITDVEWTDLSRSELDEINDLLELYPNIVSEEILERRLLHVYSRIPTITSLEA